MRLYFVLIFAAVTMAFATGYVALSLQESYVATEEDVAEIDEFKIEFLKWVEPSQIINFNSIYYSREQFKLLDPSYTLSEPKITSSAQFYSSTGCFRNHFSNSKKRYFDEKTLVWEDYRCGRRLALPRNFFIKAPFIHPSGQSYAYLAERLGKDHHRNTSWVRRHLPFFHVSELEDLRETYGRLPGIFNLLESVGTDALQGIATGKGTILTPSYLFAKLTYPNMPNIIEYRVYNRDELDKFLRDGPYALSNFKLGKPCFYRDGGLCWNYNVKHIFQIANTSSLIILFGLIIIIIVVVRLLFIKLQAQKLEDEKRRLALRVLTHEFRTPITSLMLLMERFGRKYDSFDDELEEVYLGVSAEVNRLKRLTDTSRNYLRADKSKTLMDLNIEKIPSINDFVYEIACPFLDKHEGDITFVELKEDQGICIDTYWLGICLKNLIENATFHGDFPVRIEISTAKNKIIIKVIDSGQCQYESLGIMTREFVKGNKSTGTGLGMNIVKKVCREMGVELCFDLNPTVFCLKIPLTKERL
jgi:signal transduction histidine kinase